MWQEMMKEEAEEEEIERLFMGVMGGYKDACMPPLTDFSAMDEMGCSSFGGNKRQRKEGPVAITPSDSIQKERKRRGKMAEMYSLLQSLVPSISHIHKVLVLFTNWVSFSHVQLHLCIVICFRFLFNFVTLIRIFAYFGKVCVFVCLLCSIDICPLLGQYKLKGLE